MQDLQQELGYLENLIDHKVREVFSQKEVETESKALPGEKREIHLDELLTEKGHYSRYAKHFNKDERVVLLLALAPYIAPQIFMSFYKAELELGVRMPQFGVIMQPGTHRFVPTVSTALFLLAGEDPQKRMEILSIFDYTHPLLKEHILELDDKINLLDQPLEITKEYLKLLTTGEQYQPQYSYKFPAQHLQTQQTWEDLVLPEVTRQKIEAVKVWIRQYPNLLKNPHYGKEMTGFRALFYGPSGTGKTMTATLIGQEVGLDVYRVDLSKIVSKYIGETEKNLANLFDQAIYKDWLLFFDEGDALFGKRTRTKQANDRYANQEVAYLLQRIEEHPGVIILSSNLRENIDRAFQRRFQLEIYFKDPDQGCRLLLWQKAFSNGFALEDSIDLESIAQKYVITGAGIKNVKHYTGIMALEKGGKVITKVMLKEGLEKELYKTGKAIARDF